jgi:hypothetical protein
MANDIMVTNLKRDTVTFDPVYKTGKRPSKGEKVKPSEQFVLALGSQDDDNDEAREADTLQPSMAVPDWALAELEKSKAFAHMKTTRHIQVHRAVA